MIRHKVGIKQVLGRGGAELIRAAVHEAESRTSGEIVVRIMQSIESTPDSPREAAVMEFKRLGVMNTKRRNGILLFIALEERVIELVADEGIAAVVPQAVWQAVVDIISLGFRAGFYPEAVVMAVMRIGDLLAGNFPIEPGDVNELSDDVVTDQPDERRKTK